MSSDLERFIKNPNDIFWSPAKQSIYQHYREVDAPLTRYLIGIGKWITHSPQLSSDWNWSASWEENITQGSLPSESLIIDFTIFSCIVSSPQSDSNIFMRVSPAGQNFRNYLCSTLWK